ncbi:hypothetical protein CRYUN_Cryun12cG0007200 [Craigia yunnanensis]
MQQKLRFVVFLVPLVFPPFVFSNVRRETLWGGWEPIKDINDPHVREVAEFAVSEYNKQSKASLKLKSVVKVEKQVVINYKLDLETSDGTTADAKEYEVVFWEKAEVNSGSLTSFKPIQA